VLSICTAEVAKVVETGLTDAELDRGKGQVRGGIVLGLEDPSSRMTRLGKAELVYPGLEPVEEILTAIDAVTHDDIRAIAAEILTKPKVLAVVGPFEDDAPFQSALLSPGGTTPRTPDVLTVAPDGKNRHRIGRASQDQRPRGTTSLGYCTPERLVEAEQRLDADGEACRQ
jgi:hypothetical protein